MKKRILSLLLTAVILMTMLSAIGGVSAAAEGEIPRIRGDFNADGKVDSGDALLVLQVCAECYQGEYGPDNLLPDEVWRGDVNGDGKVDTGDALLLLRYAAEIIDRLPDPDAFNGNSFLPTDPQAGKSFATLDEVIAGAPDIADEIGVKAFRYFALTTANNEALPFNVACYITDEEITAMLPSGVDVSAMLVDYEYHGDRVEYNGAIVNDATVFDFTEPVTLTLFARDGSSKTVKVNIETLNSGLPSMAVTQENYPGADAIDHDIYSKATVYLGGGNKSACPYAPSEAQLMSATIKGRGNSSWSDPKKNYTLKLDKKATLLDMDKSKNWALVGNYEDKSLTRNNIAAYFAEKAEVPYVMQSRPVDMWIDGVYWGTYNLTQKIEIEGERVNITDTKKPDDKEFTNPAANEVGYLLEFDAHVTEMNAGQSNAYGFNPDDWWFERNTTYWQGLGWSRWEYTYTNAGGEARTGAVYYNPDTDETFFQTRHCNGKWVTIKKPSTANLDYNGGAMRKYIYQKVMLLDSVIGSGNESRIANMVDIDSCARWAIVEALMDNTDSSFHSSVYVSVDAGGKFTFGPVWDFDRSAGNCDYWNMRVDELFGWGGYWSNQILTTPAGTAALKAAWSEFKAATADNWTDVLNNQVTMVYDSSKLNFTRWDIMGKEVYPNPPEVTNLATYKEQNQFLEKWIANRYRQLDAAISSR